MASVYRAIVWLCGLWCHQIPERSPHIFGVQFPLCWRCSGILFGTVLLVVFVVLTRRLPGLWVSVFIAVLLPLDVFTAVVGLASGNNGLRFVTGVGWGFFGIVAVVRLVALAVNRGNQTRREAFAATTPSV